MNYGRYPQRIPPLGHEAPTWSRWWLEVWASSLDPEGPEVKYSRDFGCGERKAVDVLFFKWKWWKKQHETWWNMGEITIKNRVFIYVTITNSVHLADLARFCVPHPWTLKLPNHTSSPSLIGYTCTGYIWIRYTSRVCSMIAGKPPTWVPNSSSVMFPSYTQPSKLMFASPSHQMLDNVSQYQRITNHFFWVMPIVGKQACMCWATLILQAWRQSPYEKPLRMWFS